MSKKDFERFYPVVKGGGGGNETGILNQWLLTEPKLFEIFRCGILLQ